MFLFPAHWNFPQKIAEQLFYKNNLTLDSHTNTWQDGFQNHDKVYIIFMLICSQYFVNFYSCLNEGIVGIPLIDLVILYVLCSKRLSLGRIYLFVFL